MRRTNDLQQRILEAMKDLQVSNWADDGEPVQYRINDDECPLMTYKKLEKELGEIRARLRVEMLELRNEGLVELCPAVDYEYYAPNGSGWMLTEKALNYFETL